MKVLVELSEHAEDALLSCGQGLIRLARVDQLATSFVLPSQTVTASPCRGADSSVSGTRRSTEVCMGMRNVRAIVGGSATRSLGLRPI